MLITLENVTKFHNEKCIFDQVDLVIEDQDKLALIGVNGCGKTTLLRILTGQENFEGKMICKNGLRISYLPQQPIFKENCSILEQVLAKDVEEYEAKSILGKLGILDSSQNISHLSGGQRKRVALAKALLKPCDLLILDEPTNHLDNEMIEWLETYLKRFTHAIFMVTHDRYFLERVCNKMVEIRQSKLTSLDANYSAYLTWCEQREELEASKERKRQSLLKKELAWMRAGVQARGTKSRDRIQRFEQLNSISKPQQEKNVKLDLVGSRLGKKIIEVEGISKRYGEKVLFDSFEYHFARNDRIGILGKNGCGKTTLLNILAKLKAADSGQVIHGDTLKIAYFKQGYEDMDDAQSVIDYIKDVSNEIQTSAGSYSASQMLERFLFPKMTHYTNIGRLSGGEKRRLYLLKVLMQAPNALFLDEPTNDLDIPTLQILEDYLDDFNGVIVVVSHDRYFLDRICDKLFVFESGHIVPYIGGYSTYIELETNKVVKTKKEVVTTTSIPKMSTKEKKELDGMETAMDDLQNKIDAIDEEMTLYPTDFEKLNSLSEQRSLLEQAMEVKMERWMELSEKKQMIDDLLKK